MRLKIFAGLIAALVVCVPRATTLDLQPRDASLGPFQVPRSGSPIAVDGALDEPAWGQAWSKELAYEVRPGENVPPPVRTEVLVTHDDDAVYFGFRAFDPEPSEIRAHLSDRDGIGPDDWVAVILDTFNDERRCFDLIVNPLGVQTDAIETASGEGEWDAIWDSAGQITDWGYAVEMRVPFSSLRFQRASGPQVWGFDAVRSYPRSQRHHIGLFPRDRSNNCYLCQAVKLSGFEGVTPGRNLELVPTLTAVRTDTRADLPAGPLGQGDIDPEAGLTARWGMTPNLILSGTLNPDFSQVEADALQLDINEPFALEYTEKRPFFLEGSDYFDTRIRAIYTRTMRNPAWGGKLTGKDQGNTIGAYVVRDDTTNLLVPGSQSSRTTTLDSPSTATVLRYRRDIGSQFTLGALGTIREGTDYFNRVLGVDGDLRFSEQDRLRVQLLGSATRYPEATAAELDQRSGELRDWAGQVYYVHSTRTLGYWGLYTDMGERFRADLGFVPRVDTRIGEAGVSYDWNPKGRTWYSSISLQGYVRDASDHDDGLLYREGIVDLQYEGPLQSHAVARLTRRREGYNGAEFDRTEVYLHNCMSPRNGTSFHVNLTLGDRVDYANTRLAQRVRLSPGIFQQLGRRLSVDLEATYEQMREDSRRLYTAQIAEATVAWHFSSRAFLRAIVQYQDYDYNLELYTDDRDRRSRDLLGQFLFSYKLNPQTVLFLGYSDVSQGTEDYDLTRTDRSFFIKLGYAWSM